MPDPTFSFLSVFFLLGVVQAVFLALALFTAKKGNREANPYLAMMLLVFALDLFNEFLDNSLYGLRVLPFMFITFTTDMLYGPLLWMYVRRMTGRRITLMGKPPVWHFLPFFIHCIVIWSNIPLASDPQLFVRFPELLLGNRIQPWIMNQTFALMAVVHIAVYLSLGIVSVRRYSANVGNRFSYLDGVGLRWLRVLLLVLLTVYVLYVLRIVFAPYFGHVQYADVALNIGLVLVIYSLGYFGLQQPAIFARLDQYESAETSVRDDQAPDRELSEPTTAKTVLPILDQEKYAKSSLAPDKAVEILNRLTDHMDQVKPYLDNKLNLAQLASSMQISSNHLSQVINEQLSQNFFDFVNGYRVEAAKKQLMQMDPKRYTILGLALDSGFNSKSAFYNGFRKHTGLTPTAFRTAHFNP